MHDMRVRGRGQITIMARLGDDPYREPRSAIATVTRTGAGSAVVPPLLLHDF